MKQYDKLNEQVEVSITEVVRQADVMVLNCVFSNWMQTKPLDVVVQ